MKAMDPHSDQDRIYQLFLLNVALQIFDGVATYEGVRLGWDEGNPLLVTAFAYLGVGPALLLFKAKACGLLVVLHRCAHRPGVPAVLGLLAGTYAMFSLVPWTAKFLTLLA
jgi:hypothetical protein